MKLGPPRWGLKAASVCGKGWTPAALAIQVEVLELFSFTRTPTSPKNRDELNELLKVQPWNSATQPM